MLTLSVDTSQLSDIPKIVREKLKLENILATEVPRIQQVIHDNFEAQGRPTHWKGYSPHTEHVGHRKLLQGSGRLMAKAMAVRFAMQGTDNFEFSAEVGEVGMVHQHGFSGMIHRRSKRGHSYSFAMHIPARPYFMLPPTEVDALVASVIRKMDRSTQ
jgi:phage gpG-like protein